MAAVPPLFTANGQLFSYDIYVTVQTDLVSSVKTEIKVSSRGFKKCWII